jgi:hypothetical protein
MEPEVSLPRSQVPATCPGPRHVFMFRDRAIFYGEELSAPLSTPKLEDHLLSAVHSYLFSIFATTHHIGGRSTTRNLRKHYTVVTGTRLSREWGYIPIISIFVLLYFALVTSFNFHLRKLQTYHCSDLYIDNIPKQIL